MGCLVNLLEKTFHNTKFNAVHSLGHVLIPLWGSKTNKNAYFGWPHLLEMC